MSMAIFLSILGIVLIAVALGGMSCRENQAKDKVKACLEAGGIPDRHGRNGYDVTCYGVTP